MLQKTTKLRTRCAKRSASAKTEPVPYFLNGQVVTRPFPNQKSPNNRKKRTSQLGKPEFRNLLSSGHGTRSSTIFLLLMRIMTFLEVITIIIKKKRKKREGKRREEKRRREKKESNDYYYSFHYSERVTLARQGLQRPRR